MKGKAMKPIVTFTFPVLLFMCILLQGCQETHFRYHEHPGDLAALKVYPFWEGKEGKKHLVGGLTVALHTKDKAILTADDFIEETTGIDYPVFLEDLEPGTYRLRVYLDDDTHVTEKVELLSGKRLTVKVDIIGVRKNEQLKAAIDDLGEGVIRTLGEIVEAAIVLIGDEIFELIIEDMLLGKDDEDDHDYDWERHDDRSPPQLPTLPPTNQKKARPVKEEGKKRKSRDPKSSSVEK